MKGLIVRGQEFLCKSTGPLNRRIFFFYKIQYFLLKFLKTENFFEIKDTAE